MGREVRRVPANWQHPEYGDDRGYIPCTQGKITNLRRKISKKNLNPKDCKPHLIGVGHQTKKIICPIGRLSREHIT